MKEEGRRVRPDFQVFSVGWSWKLRGDPEYFPQQALRELVFHAENLAPDALEGWAQSLAARRFGPAAAPHVLAAWEEIEAAQQIQSDHAYYWHHLRPAWSGPVLRSPLTIEALQTVALSGAEPPKPHGERAYAPYRDDIARSNALAPACGSPRITSARRSRTSGPHRHWCAMTTAPLSTTDTSRSPAGQPASCRARCWTSRSSPSDSRSNASAA
jgi:hypothetical protein